MRVILDTNVLVSGLLSEASPPARLIAYWRQARYILLTCEDQLEELRRVTRYPKIRRRLAPALAGRLVNDLRLLADVVGDLPRVERAPDPFDDYLLALAQKGKADRLVTGDKADLLTLTSHQNTSILGVRSFLAELEGREA